MTDRAVNRAEWRRGWPVLLASFFGSGTGVSLFTVAAGLFILPMHREFGWPISVLVMGPVTSLLVAVLLPFAGALIDRIGARRVALAGFFVYAAGLFAFAAMPGSLFAYFALATLVGIGGSPIGSITFAKCVSGWFRSRPGLPLSIMLTGVSALATLVLPLLSRIIATYGWRAGFVALGVLALVPGFVSVAALFREAPVATSASSDAQGAIDEASFAEVIRTPTFWILFSACAGSGLPVGGVLNHIFVALDGLGFDAAGIGLIASIFAISIAGGRLLSGFLLDVMRPYLVGALFFGVAAGGAAMLALAVRGAPLLEIGLATGALGMAQGALGSFFAFFLLHIFGRRAYAKAYGINSMGVALSVAAGGVLFGLIADRLGGYGWAFGLAMAMFAGAGGLMLALGVAASRYRQRTSGVTS
jgi:MFS family permease